MTKEQKLEQALERIKKDFDASKKFRSKEELDELYKDKLFYEVIKTGPSEFRVFGPLNDVFYVANGPGFLQVIEGIPRQYFTEEEIYVTKTPLVGGLSTLYKGVIENENR